MNGGFDEDMKLVKEIRLMNKQNEQLIVEDMDKNRTHTHTYTHSGGVLNVLMKPESIVENVQLFQHSSHICVVFKLSHY